MIQLNHEKRSRVLFWSLLALLLGLCFVRYALQVNFPQIILLGLAVLIAFLGDRDEIIAVCVCCIPLHTSFNYAYAVLLSIVIYGVKYARSLKLNTSIVMIVLIFVWELLHCLGQPFSIPTFVNDCIPFLLLTILFCSETQEYDYDFIVRALAVCIAAMCLLLLGKLVYTASFDLLSVFTNLRRLGLDSEEIKGSLTVVGGQQNPNALGIMCVLGMTGLMQLRMAGRKKPGDMALVMFLLMFGVLTASRTYLVCVALMGVLLLLGQKGNVSRKLKFLGAILVVVLAALGLLYLVFPTLIEFYISRFQVEDVTTGRLDLMVVYHNFIMSDPKIMFFGIGIQNFYQKVIEIYRVAALVPHNGTQELIIAWGLPGLIWFIVLWAVMIWRSRQCCKKQRIINYIPLLVILLKAQAGQMLDSPYTMLAFSFAYLSMCADLTATDPQALDETI